jgi:hypothetical protein
VHNPGELWELIPFFQGKWNAEEVTFLTIRPVGGSNVWECLCLESCGLATLVLSSTVYQRVA